MCFSLPSHLVTTPWIYTTSSGISYREEQVRELTLLTKSTLTDPLLLPWVHTCVHSLATLNDPLLFPWVHTCVHSLATLTDKTKLYTEALQYF